MAEIRKHNPAAGALGDLVRAAIGDGPRPIEPGSRPSSSDDPFDAQSPPRPEVSPSAPAVATFVPTGGWTSVSIDRLPTVTPTRSGSKDEDEDDLEFDDLELEDLDES